jgi:hypothetical protein
LRQAVRATSPGQQIIAGLLAGAIGLSAVAPALSAPADPESRPDLRLVEQERRLVILPLENDTRDRNLDYLSTGLIKILGGKVEGIGYVRADRPAQLLVVTPRGQNGPPSEGQLRRYTRTQDGSLPPSEIQRVILNVEVRELDEEAYEAIRLDRDDRKAARLDADYLITGRYFYGPGSGVSRQGGVTRRGPVSVELRVFNAITGRSTDVRFTGDLQTIYRELDRPAESIRDLVAGGGTAPVQVETAEPGAMVYLDNLYLGRTPVNGRALPGSYDLRVDQEGFQTFRRRVVIEGERTNSFRVRSPRTKHQARLKVTSQPADVRVFLDLDYIGTTPLERDDLPPGAHRLRLAKEGYVDRFIGVELSNEEAAQVSAEMQKGDTETFYRDPNYVLFDWDHYDFAFYSALGALGFYGGWIHFQIRANRINDRIRSRLPYLAIWNLSTLVNEVGAPGVLYQQVELEKTSGQVGLEQRKARVSAGLGVLTLIAAGYFLYRGLTLDAQKESGEISWFFRDNFGAGGGPDTFVRGRERSGNPASEEVQWEGGFSVSF